MGVIARLFNNLFYKKQDKKDNPNEFLVQFENTQNHHRTGEYYLKYCHPHNFFNVISRSGRTNMGACIDCKVVKLLYLWEHPNRYLEAITMYPDVPCQPISFYKIYTPQQENGMDNLD